MTLLDFANTYDSVPQQELLWAAFDIFQSTNVNNKFSESLYFGDLQISFSTPEFSTT